RTARLAADLDVRLLFQDHPKAGAHQLMIVHQDHTDHVTPSLVGLFESRPAATPLQAAGTDSCTELHQPRAPANQAPVQRVSRAECIPRPSTAFAKRASTTCPRAPAIS